MLFGKRKKDEQAKKPATIKEALEGERASQPAAEAADGGAGEASKSPAPNSGGANPAAGQFARTPRTAEKSQHSEEEAGEAAAEIAGSGPYDDSEIESRKGYLDFGALLVPAGKDQKVRLDIDQKTKRVVALTISVGQASIQVQPFSAPKSGGTWDEVREQIEASVVKQKGKVKRIDGRFGKEVAARVPTTLKDGRSGWRVARFIGFEGPRWFLRGVVGGRGAIDPKAAKAVEDLFSRIVVVRGEDPLPPRELLPLRPPEGAKRVTVPRNPAQRRTASGGPDPAAAAVPGEEPAAGESAGDGSDGDGR